MPRKKDKTRRFVLPLEPKARVNISVLLVTDILIGERFQDFMSFLLVYLLIKEFLNVVLVSFVI